MERKYRLFLNHTPDYYDKVRNIARKAFHSSFTFDNNTVILTTRKYCDIVADAIERMIKVCQVSLEEDGQKLKCERDTKYEVTTITLDKSKIFIAPFDKYKETSNVDTRSVFFLEFPYEDDVKELKRIMEFYGHNLKYEVTYTSRLSTPMIEPLYKLMRRGYTKEIFTKKTNGYFKNSVKTIDQVSDICENIYNLADTIYFDDEIQNELITNESLSSLIRTMSSKDRTDEPHKKELFNYFRGIIKTKTPAKLYGTIILGTKEKNQIKHFEYLLNKYKKEKIKEPE